MESKFIPLHVQVANQLIEQLKKGTVPWQKPWNTDGIPLPMLPFNAQSGNRYRGINAMNLILSGHTDPRWLTFKQAEAMDAKIMRGERGTLIQFVKTHQQRPLRDESGRPVFDELGNPVSQRIALDRAIVSNAWVFNAEQVSGLPSLEPVQQKAANWDPISRAEALIGASGADIRHKYIDSAYYDIRYDAITLPERSQFRSSEGYYATALHELSHWTGHPTRLDRATLMNNGMIAYAKEELRAELASMFIGAEMQLGANFEQHASYLESWVSILEDAPMEIHCAASDAEKIFDFLIAIEQKLSLSQQNSPMMNVLDTASEKSFLSTGDEITYRDSLYRIEGHMKQGRIRVGQEPSGVRFTMSTSDPLYTALLDIKLGKSLSQQPVVIQDGLEQHSSTLSNLKR